MLTKFWYLNWQSVQIAYVKGRTESNLSKQKSNNFYENSNFFSVVEATKNKIEVKF